MLQLERPLLSRLPEAELHAEAFEIVVESDEDLAEPLDLFLAQRAGLQPADCPPLSVGQAAPARPRRREPLVALASLARKPLRGFDEGDEDNSVE